MTAAKVTAKVTPYDLHVPPPKENNFFTKGTHIIKSIKFIIMIQVLLGLNRLYLFKCGVIILWLSYFYTGFLVVMTMYVIVIGDTYSGVHVIIRDAANIEYLLLVITSLLFQKKTLVNFIHDLAIFDETINVTKEIGATLQMVHRAVVWMTLSLIYSIIEYYTIYVYASGHELRPSILVVYVAGMAHDSEVILYVTMIRAIKIRLQILKTHIVKAFGTESVLNNSEEPDKIESMANNAHLDTTAMHRAYELLHKCAEQLNSVMSFPMILMLFSAGLGTTLLLKNFFQRSDDDANNLMFQALIMYTSVRCFKYTALVVIPCYYASVTTRQVSVIRTTLHNAVNTFKLDKIERRKIKALFQLTKDNEFAYALWGVIQLSMSLPLSYASLCTTYLVITIQFSKFID
ncbi:uncharacterized protein LOC126370166 [Pectinophora gossypiella]|uniref:uncharacterized protein LOC126370166 n=1 Tax=Pectinophora gossypiella TaxID=13191 RepID=UPI00214F4FF9|nr:uncharacterized protein LOC126370166 [Pectinophora gossypiella]